MHDQGMNIYTARIYTNIIYRNILSSIVMQLCWLF